jgi:hypothetical protein
MEKLTRRSVLKSLAKISAGAAVAPLIPAIVGCGHTDRRISLNVVLHGLFVVNITDFSIEILTPKICEHIYKVGNWDASQIWSLDQDVNYVLRGVNPEKKLPPVDWKCTPVFCQSKDKFTINREASHCRVMLPFPAGLKMLRHSEVDPMSDDPAPSYTCNSNYVVKNITKVSLCQVLTYMVPDYRALHLAGSKWVPDIDWQTYTANLHFWAEPPYRLTPHHANDAYSQLSCLLPPLNLKLRVYSTVALDKTTGICGFPPEQEQGWSDWASGGGEGVHPTNCCAVVTRK